MRILAAYMFLAFFLNSCASEEWEGFVYPNSGDFLSYESIGRFNSLEDCRSASIAKLSEMNARNQGSYECGKRCRLSARGQECSVKAY